MAKVKTTIADILAGADALSVLADKFEEIGEDDLSHRTARLSGDAYNRAGSLLELDGRALNAREAFTKARDHFERAGADEEATLAAQRRHYNWPTSGNIYGE